MLQLETAAEITRLERLLSLYSLQKLDHCFATGQKSKDAVIRHIVDSAGREEIVDFAYRYHPTSKHHLHLFEHKGTHFGTLPDDPLGLPSLEKTETTRYQRSWFYIIDLKYTVFLRDPLEDVKIKFPWPILVACTSRRLHIRFTIMEPSIASRFKPGRIIRIDREFDETALQERVREKLHLPGLAPFDINKGIKELWAADLIDSPSIQWKKAISTSREVMDTSFLLKRDEPDLYKSLIDKPLFNAIFLWVGSSGVSLKQFTVDASQGILTFRTFSDLATGANHVVREILQRN